MKKAPCTNEETESKLLHSSEYIHGLGEYACEVNVAWKYVHIFKKK